MAQTGGKGAEEFTIRVPDQLPKEFEEDPVEFSADEIMAVAREAQKLPGTYDEKVSAMKEKHRAFWFRYPALLEMCCRAGMNMGHLRYMLSMLDAVKKKSKNLDDADRDVHSMLASKYNVQVPPPPSSSSS
jgi:hypothetical protein